jgi:hypothetical protein
MRLGFAFLTKSGFIFHLRANFLGIQSISQTPGIGHLIFEREGVGDEQDSDVVF